jgi:hypothetical protein
VVVVSYTVKLYKAPTYTDAASIDLTEDVLSIPIFTDTGDGDINTATLRLNGRDGKYSSGSTAIADHDRIKIYVTDSSSNLYQRCFEVMSKVPIKNKIEPQTLQLELAGVEIAFQRIRVSMNTFDLSTQDLYEKLMETYEQNRTAEMPAVTYDKADIPNIMSNLDWSSEDTILNRLNELVDSFGASGENNGVLNYFDMRFTTSTSDTSAPTTIDIVIASSGLLDIGSYETITDTIEILGKVEPALVSQVAAWGANEYGSLPVEWSKFAGRQLIMPENRGSTSNFPIWISGQIYPENSRVRINETGNNDRVYRKKNDSNASLTTIPYSNLTDWDLVTTSTFYGGEGTLADPGIAYSPWTGGSDGAKHWKNNGAGFSSSPFTNSATSGNTAGLCFFDGNLIINDTEETKGMFRTWADIAKPTDIFSGDEYELLYGANNTTGKYKGLRVLVTGGTVGGAFAGYDNHIMEYDGTSWVSKYQPGQTGMRVAVLYTAKIYEYSTSGSGSWTDVASMAASEAKNGLDCFHPYDSLVNTTSSLLDPDIAKSTAIASRQYTGVNNNSAITVTYTWNISSTMMNNALTDIIGDSISTTASVKNNYYSSGAWLNFRLPFPVNTLNSSSTAIGALYGGSTSTAKVPYLDLANNTYTHDGKLGYNEESSEDLGEISSVDFNIKLKYAGAGGGSRIVKSSSAFNLGNFPMRCFLIDGDDHVIMQEFMISFNDTWQRISLDIGGFKLYKGRKPLKAAAWSNVVPLKELEYIDIFESRNVRMMCICTKDSYDSYDRFAPQNNMFGGDSRAPAILRTLELSIDALRFTKPLLAITPVVSSASETVKQADFLQRPNIIVHDQLEGDAQSELDKQSFPYEEYNITTKANFLSGYGEYFFLTDNMINHTDGINSAGDMTNSGNANTVVLVAKHIEYSITKPIKNLGGLVRKIRGIRRFLA